MLYVDARAGRIGNSERIDQISIPIEQRVEGHVMEQFVWYNDEAPPLHFGQDGSQ